MNLFSSKKILLLATLLIHFVLVGTYAHAVNDAERQELTRLLEELTWLDNIILVARNSTDGQEREMFHYEMLEQDLSQIRQGIRDYLNGERREPRTLPAIEGQYTTYGR